MATATHYPKSVLALVCALTVALGVGPVACEHLTGVKPAATERDPYCLYRGDTVGLLTVRDSAGITTHCIYFLADSAILCFAKKVRPLAHLPCTVGQSAIVGGVA